jgi:hypothetical protein
VWAKKMKKNRSGDAWGDFPWQEPLINPRCSSP